MPALPALRIPEVVKSVLASLKATFRQFRLTPNEDHKVSLIAQGASHLQALGLSAVGAQAVAAEVITDANPNSNSNLSPSDQAIRERIRSGEPDLFAVTSTATDAVPL
jgi:hypothetical protein